MRGVRGLIGAAACGHGREGRRPRERLGVGAAAVGPVRASGTDSYEQQMAALRGSAPSPILMTDGPCLRSGLQRPSSKSSITAAPPVKEISENQKNRSLTMAALPIKISGIKKIGRTELEGRDRDER